MNSKLFFLHLVKFRKCITHCLKVFIVGIFLSYLCSIVFGNPCFTIYFNFSTCSKKPSNCSPFFIYLNIANITAMKNGSAVYCSKVLKSRRTHFSPPKASPPPPHLEPSAVKGVVVTPATTIILLFVLVGILHLNAKHEYNG